jgi:hypothetical protein
LVWRIWESVPELAGRTLVGVGPYTGTNKAGTTETSTYLLKQEGGEITHQLTETELPLTKIYVGWLGADDYKSYTELNTDYSRKGMGGSHWGNPSYGQLYDTFGRDVAHNVQGPYKAYTACKKNNEKTAEEVEIMSLRSGLTSTQAELETLKKNFEGLLAYYNNDTSIDDSKKTGSKEGVSTADIIDLTIAAVSLMIAIPSLLVIYGCVRNREEAVTQKHMEKLQREAEAKALAELGSMGAVI